MYLDMQKTKFHKDVKQEGSNFFHFIFSGQDLKKKLSMRTLPQTALWSPLLIKCLYMPYLICMLIKKLILTGSRHCFDFPNHQRHMQNSTLILNIPKYISSCYTFSIRLQNRLKKSEQDLWACLTFHLYQNTWINK